MFADIEGSFSIVRFGEEFRVMEPDIVDSTVFACVDSELMFKVSLFDPNVHLMFEPILNEVVRFFFLVELIVGGHNIHFLANSGQLL